MTRYNARTTNPSKFLEPKFNINPDYQNKISEQIIKTNYPNILSKQNYQNKLSKQNFQNKFSRQDYQNKVIKIDEQNKSPLIT